MIDAAFAGLEELAADAGKADEAVNERFEELTGKQARITPGTFFAVHCEPSTASDRMFLALKRLVELAHRYNARLTFEFAPQWAEMILADEKKLALLREWQKDGHEVGAHHHPLYHIGQWDGYTDTDPKELKERRIDARGETHQREKYLGTMVDYMKLLNQLAAPERVVTGCFARPPRWARIPADEMRFELPEGILCETEGFKEKPRPPEEVENDGRKWYRLPMFFVGSHRDLLSLCEKYLAVKEGDVVGLVTHAFNFERSPEVFEDWFKFLQSKDPEGKHSKTVSEIMTDRPPPKQGAASDSGRSALDSFFAVHCEPPAVPQQIKIRGYKVWWLPIFALDVIEPAKKLARLRQLYNRAKPDAVAGVVIHEFDIDGHPEIIEDWFKLLQSRDPEGKHNKTPSQIMKERLAQMGTRNEGAQPRAHPRSAIHNAQSQMPPIKIACLYEPLTSTIGGRDTGKVVEMLSELKPDLVFRAFFKWGPCPQAKYGELKQAVAKLKKRMPDILIVGGVAPQFLPRNEADPDTGLPIPQQVLHQMAFLPESLGIGFDLDKLPGYFEAMSSSEIFSPGGGFFPDMANPEFRDLLLRWAEQQIDAGVDAVWFDLPLEVPRFAIRAKLIDRKHPIYTRYWDAWRTVVERTRAYARKKHDRHIYIGCNGGPTPGTDFVTLPLPLHNREAFLDGIPDQYFKDMKAWTRREMGRDVPILTFIDWGATVHHPLGVFSQQLSTEEQQEALKKLDEQCKQHGMVFVHPVHGGFLGREATRTAFGRFKVYDSVAFGTHQTVMELMQTGGKRK